MLKILSQTKENIIANADKIKGALGEKVRNGKENAIMSKQLATIILDVPWKSTNFVVGTKFVNFKVVAFTANTNMQAILARVDTVWPFNDWGNYQSRVYTNTICTYIAPDNIDPALLGK